MRMKKSIVILLVCLTLVIIIGANFTVSAKGYKKNQYWIATNCVLDPEVTHGAFTSTWYRWGGYLSRSVYFEWHTYSNDNIVTLESQGRTMSGVKAECKVYSSGNDMFFYLRIYKGGFKSSKIPETYVWAVINGKDLTNSQFIILFTNLYTGESSESIPLGDGEEDIVKLPKGNTYYCRMYFY